MKRLKPVKPDPVVTPQCQAPFDINDNWGEYYLERRKARCAANGWNIHQCARPSTYEIDGEFLCTQHTGLKAIEILLKN